MLVLILERECTCCLSVRRNDDKWCRYDGSLKGCVVGKKARPVAVADASVSTFDIGQGKHHNIDGVQQIKQIKVHGADERKTKRYPSN